MMQPGLLSETRPALGSAKTAAGDFDLALYLVLRYLIVPRKLRARSTAIVVNLLRPRLQSAVAFTDIRERHVHDHRCALFQTHVVRSIGGDTADAVPRMGTAV